jgi:ketosteroid isomerase-like protein
VASANLELVRSIYAAWERGDYSSAEWAHSEIEFVLPDGPDPGHFKGKAEMAEAWRGRLSGWEDVRIGVEEIRELDDERVLVVQHFSGRGKTSGLDLGRVQAQRAALVHIRDGKVTKYVAYWDRELAFADLGLSSEAGSRSS